ncbi:MAG: hypothetical protein AAFV29_23085, partial [Myxococcota bacterium]
MRRAALFFLLVAASCGGGTCGGCVDGAYQFPQDDPARPDAIVQENVVRTRITQEFLDFIRPQLPELILAQAGQSGGSIDPSGIIRIPVPNVEFDAGIAVVRVRNAEAQLFLDDLEQRLDLRIIEPDRIALVINRLRVGLDLKLKGAILGDFSCPITGDLGSNPKHFAEMTVRAVINPAVGARPDYNLDIDVGVGNIDIDDIGIDILPRSVYCEENECQDCTIE